MALQNWKALGKCKRKDEQRAKKDNQSHSGLYPSAGGGHFADFPDAERSTRKPRCHYAQ
jgi:hypothetical protein